MTNRIAIGLAIVIAGLFAVDAWAFGGTLPVFLGRKGLELIEWIAFWR